MTENYLDSLRKVKADFEAAHRDIDARLTQLERERIEREREQVELEQKRDELRELIEGMDGVLSRAESRNRSALLQEGAPTTNGLPKNATRRQVVLQIIPGFHGEPFTAGDVREKYLERYIDYEPTNFAQAISNLLKRMVRSGDIEVVGRRGEGHTAPWLYREKNREDTLLESGP